LKVVLNISFITFFNCTLVYVKIIGNEQEGQWNPILLSCLQNVHRWMDVRLGVHMQWSQHILCFL
jgi:hypothetical protein